MNADSPQVWESPHAELKKEFIFTFENSWTDSKNQEEPASVWKGVWLAHTPMSVPECSEEETLSCRFGCDPEQ